MEKLKFKRDILLRNYTTFKIGGPAKYFFKAETEQELIKAIKAAKEMKLDFFILGSGGNVLVSDEGFNGLVIKVKNEESKVKNYNLKLKISCGSGLSLSKLVAITTEKNLTGMEWAAGVPGTLGGAFFGNAGAFGQSISDVVRNVKAVEIKNYKIKNFGKKDCKFKYRDSIFKRNKNLIIISAELEFKKDDKEEIRKRIKQNLKWRKKHQPLEYPSAGSVFKNASEYSAGQLIEQCGLKGKKIGQAQVSKKHANFIINLGGAKSEDVSRLIKLIKTKVKQKFNIQLKEEIEYLGFPH